ncbi:MAG: hypothetical protein WAO71_07285 [Gallionella sp.]
MWAFTLDSGIASPEEQRGRIRTTYLKERRDIMQKWADHLDAIQSGAKIIPLHREAA